MKICFLVVALLGVVVHASAGPYVSFTRYSYNGCNATLDNYVTDLYLYPADGTCFTPSGGYLATSLGYKITSIDHGFILIFAFSKPDCTGTQYYPQYLPTDFCSSADNTVISLFQTLPPNQYWADMGIIGPGHQPWETVLVTYYGTGGHACQNDTIQVQGWPKCSSGNKYYCQDNEIHYDTCTDRSSCNYGCYQTYLPLSDSCIAADSVTQWSSYLDGESSSSYQSFCAEAAPIPSTTPESSESSSSDGTVTTTKFWVLLMVVCSLVSIIVGLMLGLLIFSLVKKFIIWSNIQIAKKRAVSHGYMQVAPPAYGTIHMPVAPMMPPPQYYQN